MPNVRAEALVPTPPGEVLTGLIMRVSLRSGGSVRPRLSGEETILDLPTSALGGSGEIRIAAREEGTRVVLVGWPPPWPLRIGWARRTLRRLVGRVPMRWID